MEIISNLIRKFLKIRNVRLNGNIDTYSKFEEVFTETNVKKDQTKSFSLHEEPPSEGNNKKNSALT